MSLEQAVTDLETRNAQLVTEVVRVRDAAMGMNRLYPTSAEGLADVADGQYFSVPGDGAFLRLYRRQGAQAALISDYPTRQSAEDAAVQAQAAADSAAAALASEQAAAASQGAAATSETNAGNSETAAAGSASAASTSETNAAGSATAASTSETNAAGSATAASTSATNAATSETNAAASETAAELAAANAQSTVEDYHTTRASATLDLDFASGDYAQDGGEKIRTTNANELLSVQRASPKWVFGPNGKLREVPVDTVAREWDPATGKPRGVLIEESRTNLLTYSEAFDNAVWSSSGTASSAIVATVTPNTHIAPDGTQTADSVFFDSDGQYRRLQTVSVTAITRYTCSIYVKKGDYPDVQIYLGTANANARIQYNFDTDSITELDDDNTGVGYRELLPNGWVKLVFGAVPHSTGTTTFGMIQHATTAGHVVLWGAQIEQASTASSYIPTTTAPVTRAQDTVKVVDLAEWKGHQGTFHLTVSEAASADLLAFDGTPILEGASGEGSVTYSYDGGTAEVYVDGTLVYTLTEHHLVDIAALTELVGVAAGNAHNGALRYMPYTMAQTDVQGL